jgi:hypothetical protein
MVEQAQKTTDPTPNAPTGRTNKGRFAKGNPGGPGNPLGVHYARLTAAVVQAVTPQQVAEIMAKLHQMACEGDVQAAKVVLDWCVKKPAAEVEIQHKDAAAVPPDEMSDADLIAWMQAQRQN